MLNNKPAEDIKDTTILRYCSFDVSTKHIFSKKPTIQLSKCKFFWINGDGLTRDPYESKASLEIIKHQNGTISEGTPPRIIPAITSTHHKIDYGFGHQFISCWSLPHFQSEDAHAAMVFLGHLHSYIPPPQEIALVIASTIEQIEIILKKPESKKKLPNSKKLQWSLKHKRCAYYPQVISEDKKIEFDSLERVNGFGFMKHDKYSIQKEYRFIYSSNIYEIEEQNDIQKKRNEYIKLTQDPSSTMKDIKKFSNEEKEKREKHLHVKIDACPTEYINKCYINPNLTIEEEHRLIEKIKEHHPELEIIHSSSKRPIVTIAKNQAKSTTALLATTFLAISYAALRLGNLRGLILIFLTLDLACQSS